MERTIQSGCLYSVSRDQFVVALNPTFGGP